MEWLGLSLGQASLLFGALAITLTALYLGRRNLLSLRVPHLPFWRDSAGGSTGGTLRRLRSPLSLLLALAIVLSLVLALGQPRPRDEPPPRTVVFLLDRSASMAARDEQPSRLERAKRALLQQVGALRAQDHYLVLALEEQAMPVARTDAELGTLAQALAQLRPGSGSGDLEQGVLVAVNALVGAERPALVLLSDGRLRGAESAQARLRDQPKIEVRQLRFGKEQRNLAIRQLAARSYPLDRAHHELLISIENTGGRAETVRLEVNAGQTPLLHEELRLSAHETSTRTLSDLVHAGDRVSARITAATPDPLPADDTLEVQLPARRRTRVLAVSTGNRYLEAALLLEEYLDVSWRAPERAIDWQAYDVAIFDGALPNEPLQLPALVLAPFVVSPAQPLVPQGSSARPLFERWDRDHPLLRGLALGDVNLTRAARTRPAASDRVLASGAGGLPLIVEGARQQPFIALTFDVRESDLPLRAAWPLLVLAAVEQLSSSEGPAAVLPPARNEDTELGPRLVLAAHSSESARATFEVELWQLLVIAALIMLSLEWLTFQRRVTS